VWFSTSARFAQEILLFMNRLPCTTLALVAVSLTAAASAQRATIQSGSAPNSWLLSAGGMSYVVAINDANMPQTVYWGPRLASTDGLPLAKMHPAIASFEPSIATTPLEYPAWGGGLDYEPAVKASFPDGNRELTLVYDKASQPAPDTLEITLHDTVEPVVVHLFYQVFPQGVVARWSEIENYTNTTVTLANANSSTWNLPPDPRYQLSWLTGRWGGEWQLQHDAIRQGTRILESRRGSTGHQNNPWFAVSEDGVTSENSGPVWFGELAWSGSWRISVEEDEARAVRITGGYNPFDFSYPLAPGASLETPHFYGGYTASGQGEASRVLHRLQEQVIVPEAPHPKLRPVLYNSWEATGFDVNEAGQIALADRAAKIGVERFVIDDGWFGQRKTDHAGLGDWYVNPQKFPHGLKPIIDHVHSLGMDFGIWVEPEMVNPDSDLYRKHPDWAMHFPGRPGTEERNQFVLNLARPDVRAYVFGFLDKLVSENQISFLKWDYNRNWSEPGWDSVPLAEQQTIYIKYVQNLYSILAELRKKHPGLEIESCSGGGGRVDDGILHYTDEVWPSDNTDALDRLSIQNGLTYAYSPGVMMAWVTDVPNSMDGRTIPLGFRFDVAMTGSLGMGGNLNQWTDAEMQYSATQIAFYKTIRGLVQQGSLYRLTPSLATAGDWATEYVAPDQSEAVVFAFLHSQQFGEPFPLIHLEGLDPDATYAITPRDGEKGSRLPKTASGAALMGAGVPVVLRGDYDSTAFTFKKQ
jgi:alpha-galactosidase